MVQKTQGLVLRALKYGETSLIVNIFTRLYGVQSYLVQGVRSAKQKQQRAGLLQPGMLLDMVVYQKQQNLQRIKEFQPAYIYQSLHEQIVKNSIALFSVEVLLRILPEHASMPEAYDFSFEYLKQLDVKPMSDVANYPIFFLVAIGRLMGFDISGNYSSETPHLHLQEGVFASNPPAIPPYLSDAESKALSQLLQCTDMEALKTVGINSQMRFNLLDWYLEFLHRHTQHFGNVRSLEVLRAILH
ncbi:DNA repair protein RecO [Polluticoccus soli]|uniref:DNA repair protein RecO n=1 Tax=Polluticoccus soli TaxID=3034150 RepID=UPI0023E1E33D|nr:DNA repair protein RecO [Flavipsychrobacter sp. JY13-12]